MALGFYLCAIVYPVIRVWTWHEPAGALGEVVGWILLCVALFTPLGLFIARFMLRLRFPEQLMQWIYVAIASCFLLLPVVLVLEIARWVPGFPAGFEPLIAITSALGLAAYAALNARRVVVKTVQIANTTNLADHSIVQLSDVHIGSRSTAYLDAIVDKVISLQPTWIVITGDLLDSAAVGVDELAPLKRIAERTLWVTGNHERYEGLDKVTSLLQAINIKTLRNATFDAKPFQFIGIDDHDSSNFLISMLQQLQPVEDAYRVLLYHRPHGMHEASDWGADLMLVGHTHRGQIFPFHFVVNRFFEYSYGTYQFDRMTLHVSSGTGTWGPILRLGSRNEITHVVFA